MQGRALFPIAFRIAAFGVALGFMVGIVSGSSAG